MTNVLVCCRSFYYYDTLDKLKIYNLLNSSMLYLFIFIDSSLYNVVHLPFDREKRREHFRVYLYISALQM